MSLAIAGAVIVLGVSGCASAAHTSGVAAGGGTATPVDVVATAAASPTPTAAPTRGILTYALGDGSSAEVDLSLLDPTTGAAIAEHPFAGSVLSLDAHAGGYARPSANRAFSSDLTMTYFYGQAADGTRQLSVVLDNGRTIPVSAALAQSDSFSGALSASSAFFRGGDLYFSMSNKDVAPAQYSIAETRLVQGALVASDFTKSNVSESADGVSGADIIGAMQTDCGTHDGKQFVDSLGFLSTGRYVGLVSNGTWSGTTIAAYAPGCRSYVGVDKSGTALVPKTQQNIAEAVVSPDGTRVAFVATQGGVATLYTVPATGGQPTKVTVLSSTKVMLAGWR